MKVKLLILTTAVLAVGQSQSEPLNDFYNENKDPGKTLKPEGPIKTAKCPKDEDPANPTVLPYPDDCTKFYKCLHGQAYPISCPNGLHFSVELNRCDWPEVAKCDPNIKVPATPSPIPSSTPVTGTTEGPVKHPLCPPNEDPRDPTVLPHPGDCSKFYKCLHGNAHPISCPSGLHWSAALNRCDWPEVAKCVAKPTTFTDI